MRTLSRPDPSVLVDEGQFLPFRPICPSCSQGMCDAPGYFQCPLCGFGLCENYGGEELEMLLVSKAK